MYRFEIYRDWRGEFRWRLISDRGHVLATSGDNYPTGEVAFSAVQGLKSVLGAASIEMAPNTS